MRYDRLEPLELSTKEIKNSTVTVVGAGATGSRMLEQLVRIGADIRIIDRDLLEEENLATSALYTEEQVKERLPKAVAAKERLEDINSDTKIKSKVADLNSQTVDSLLSLSDIILDGTDNMETRFLVNEWCVKNSVPWVHVSAIRSSGEVMPIVPDRTSCFNCVFEGVKGSSLETCETAGISPAAASVAASVGVRKALEVLEGSVEGKLTRFDLEKGDFQELVTGRESCNVCKGEEFPYLEGDEGTTAIAVCGEDKYQVNPGSEIDLEGTADKLEESGTVTLNSYLLRFDGDEKFTLFQDGRMIVEAESREGARSVYSRFIGN
ncbi:MAG: ThiF family adenylyltransferase [Candidatus Nanohaloarchaeota archaeon QJJ-7]|nr:ThiF family adenylyltransferase [Candidatus Nanohaloarchaeota archaeon QJJ-7]